MREMFLFEQPRVKEAWLDIISRFESFQTPHENDIVMALEHCKFRMKVLGKSLDCLQEVGNEQYHCITLSNDALVLKKHISMDIYIYIYICVEISC